MASFGVYQGTMSCRTKPSEGQCFEPLKKQMFRG